MSKQIFENPRYSQKAPHEHISAPKLLFFSAVILGLAWLVIDNGSADRYGIVYMICFLSGLGVIAASSILAWRQIRKLTGKTREALRFSTKGQRAGLVACACSLLIGAPSAHIASQYSWYCWYRPNGLYETLFFLSVITFLAGILLLFRVPQRILSWVQSGQ